MAGSFSTSSDASMMSFHSLSVNRISDVLLRCRSGGNFFLPRFGWEPSLILLVKEMTARAMRPDGLLLLHGSVITP